MLVCYSIAELLMVFEVSAQCEYTMVLACTYVCTYACMHVHTYVHMYIAVLATCNVALEHLRVRMQNG